MNTMEVMDVLATDKGWLLEELGRLMSVDVVLNNWGRLPLIWDFDGSIKDDLYVVGADEPTVDDHRRGWRKARVGFFSGSQRRMHLIGLNVSWKPVDRSRHPRLRCIRGSVRVHRAATTVVATCFPPCLVFVITFNFQRIVVLPVTDYH